MQNGKPGAGPTLRYPWVFWLVGGYTAAFAFYYLGRQYMDRHQSNVEPVQAILFLYVVICLITMFIQHRNAWIVMIACWLTAIGVVLYGDLTSPFPLSVFDIAVPLCFAVCVAVSMFYFRYPYILMRSNLIGPAERFYLNLDATLTVGGTSYNCPVRTLSVKGFAISRGECPDLKMRQTAWLSIPDIEGFKSKVRIANQTDQLIMMEILGFTFSSVTEHLKLRRHVLRHLKSVAAANKSGVPS